MPEPLKFEFVTKDIFNFLHDTDSRMKAMINLPPEHSGLLRIEDINVGEQWPSYFQHMQEVTRTLVPTIELERIDAYKLAFYMDFVALFFKYHGDETDKDYVSYVDTFFDKYKELIGPRSENILFYRAFPK